MRFAWMSESHLAIKLCAAARIQAQAASTPAAGSMSILDTTIWTTAFGARARRICSQRVMRNWLSCTVVARC